MKYVWLIVAASLFLMLAGCDRAPKNLGPEYHKGKCVVCKRSTMVSQKLVNPYTGYGVDVCWKDDCQRKYGVHPEQYYDKNKAFSANDIPAEQRQ